MACLYGSNEDERLFGKGVGKEKQLRRLEIVFVLSTGINGNYDCCSCATRGLSHHGCWCVTTSDILSLISFQLCAVFFIWDKIFQDRLAYGFIMNLAIYVLCAKSTLDPYA
jgi:hypothetical protein